jgi:hypothetical protein
MKKRTIALWLLLFGSIGLCAASIRYWNWVDYHHYQIGNGKWELSPDKRFCAFGFFDGGGGFL